MVLLATAWHQVPIIVENNKVSITGSETTFNMCYAKNNIIAIYVKSDLGNVE